MRQVLERLGSLEPSGSTVNGESVGMLRDAGMMRKGMDCERFECHHSVGLVVNARLSSVFCSNSCALAEPVAGLALGERLMERIFRPLLCTNWPMRGTTKKCAPMFFGSSWTHTTSRALGCSSMAAEISGRNSGYS